MSTAVTEKQTPLTISGILTFPSTQKFLDDTLKENRKEFVYRDFSERMINFSKTIKEKQKEIKELILKKKLSKRQN